MIVEQDGIDFVGTAVPGATVYGAKDGVAVPGATVYGAKGGVAVPGCRVHAAGAGEVRERLDQRFLTQ